MPIEPIDASTLYEHHHGPGTAVSQSALPLAPTPRERNISAYHPYKGLDRESKPTLLMLRSRPLLARARPRRAQGWLARLPLHRPLASPLVPWPLVLPLVLMVAESEA